MPDNLISNLEMSEIWVNHIYDACTQAEKLLKPQVQSLQAKESKVDVQGHLNKTSTRGYARWRYILDPEESASGKREIQYLGKSEQSLLQKLAFKMYIQCNLRLKMTELKAAKAFIRKIDTIDEHTKRMVKDPDLRQILQNGKTTSNWIQDWYHADYNRNTMHPETLKIHAVNGENVRSKSEAIIVSELVKAEIPFHYEQAVSLNDMTVFPDFVIRHPVTGKEYIWEHFGMMDDPQYAANASRKIMAYAAEGYIIGNNMIVTGETKDRPLDYRKVRAIILSYFRLNL